MRRIAFACTLAAAAAFALTLAASVDARPLLASFAGQTFLRLESPALGAHTQRGPTDSGAARHRTLRLQKHGHKPASWQVITVTTPDPVPDVTPTPTPVPSPLPSAPPSSLVDRLQDHPNLVLTDADLSAIRARIDAGLQPQAEAFATFMNGRAKAALAATPNVFAGPYRGGTDIHTVFDGSLTRDGSLARNLGLAYAITGEERYAAKARAFILAWAMGNSPTTLRDHDSVDTGQMQSYGAFSLAYAYDLTYDSGVYTTADRSVIGDYFTRFIAALKNCMTKISNDAEVRSDSPRRIAYGWNPNLTIRVLDARIGGNFAMLQDAAVAAMAATIGDVATLRWVYAGEDNLLRVNHTLDHSLTPDNDGDGAGTRPAPQSHIYKAAISGRGGTLDYCTYNARIASVLGEMGENLGFGTLTAYQGKFRTTWLYLARFFGPGAQRSPNPYDSVNLSVNLPRFTLAYHDLGDSRFVEVLESGDRNSYYESQLLGPVTLTHSIAR